MTPDFDGILKLIMSCFLGGVVGYERQSRNKAAGLRTHILVSLGSCLVMILSMHISLDGRLAAQVISGIGFLGAGAIFSSNKNHTVIGLTTAASLWVVAAIGLAVGAGYWLEAHVATALVFVTLTVLSRIEIHMTQADILMVSTLDLPGQIEKINTCLKYAGIDVQKTRVDIESCNADHLGLFIHVKIPAQMTTEEVMAKLRTVQGVISVQNKF